MNIQPTYQEEEASNDKKSPVMRHGHTTSLESKKAKTPRTKKALQVMEGGTQIVFIEMLFKECLFLFSVLSLSFKRTKPKRQKRDFSS